MSILVMGCDPHLDTVAVGVVDGVGAEIASVTVPNTREGWDTTLGWCHRLGVTTVGIEGASGYGRCLAQRLTAAGIDVFEVPTRVTARTRRIDGAGKTDPGDARTIARATVRGAGHRWVDDTALETLRVLTARRDHLVQTQTSDINHMRALIGEIDPPRAATLPRLRSTRQLQQVAAVTYDGDEHRHVVGELITQIAQGCIHRLSEVRSLERRIDTVMPDAGRRLIARIDGCGLIVAAQLLSQMAGADAFATDAKFAAWAGIAPLDASSGRQQRHRLNRRGNRQANRAIHTIVITQLRQHGEAHHYVNRRLTEGKTRNEAIRAAKRYAARRIWKTLQLT